MTRPRLGLAVFFLIAFGVPWAGWIYWRQRMSLDHMFDSFATLWFTAAPSIAGFVAAFVEGGAAGLGQFARRVFNLRFPVWIWLAMLALPLLAGLLTFIDHPGDLLAGGAPKFARALAAATLLNFFTGPIAEEFGWRGYLLGTFGKKLRPVFAGLAIGPIWALWHLPIFYDSVFATLPSALSYVLWTTAWSVVLCVLVTRARGAVLPSVLGHWMVNAAPSVFFALLPALPGEKQPGGFAFMLASVAVAAVVALLARNLRWEPYGSSTVAPVV
ncbi:MAG TPA: CPBP family intramembrane glutamic endopeptidase [Rhizomicrobium sp.]|jgi:membrane protease YdiL (CAAX protease family)